MKRTTWTVATTLAMLAITATVEAQGPAQPGAAPPRRSIFSRAPRDPAVMPAAAQVPADIPATPPANPEPEPTAGTYDSNAALPEPKPLDELEKPTIVLPTAPIEPYMLQRHNGPFMVLAHTFRGPQASRYAQALAMELRNQHRMPAYVFFLRFQPGHSNIRGVPPTAPPQVRSGEAVTPPEQYRSYDEAAVLVGDCKTIDESEKVLHQVKKLRSQVIDGLPSIWTWRKGKGLSRATLTTNPLVASQDLFPAQEGQHAGTHMRPAGPPGAQGLVAAPGQTVDPAVLAAGFTPKREADKVIKQMNSGPQSATNCPGPFMLEVASYLGRSTTDPNDKSFMSQNFLKQSPLAAAAAEAENLATSIGKCKSLPPGLQAYVFHDRSSSRVFLGPFSGPGDARLKMAVTPNVQGMTPVNAVSLELIQRGFTQRPLAPAGSLTPVPQF